MGVSGKNRKLAAAATEKTGHRVLLFGKQLVGDLTPSDLQHANATLDIIPFPEGWERLDRLTNCSLVILGYTAFSGSGYADVEKQDVFDKMLSEALEYGTSFCFVHYDESVPKHDKYEHDNAYMNRDSCRKHRQDQIGFRVADAFSIKPHRYDNPLTGCEIKRNEFRPFISQWGASHNYFKTYGRRKIDDLICSVADYPVGFAMHARNRLIFFLPFQRDFTRKKDVCKGLTTLVDCLLTYVTKTVTEIPQWAREPFFAGEQAIADECEKLKEALGKKARELDPFTEGKQLLCQSEYSLESGVPSFFEASLGIPTQRDEEYKEDFWIVEESEKKVICEVKSYVKGFKKSGIYSLHNHRESRKLPDDFPALLVVNCNLQAACWKDKPIAKQDCEAATSHAITIMRIEDIVRFWDMLRVGAATSLDLMSHLLHHRGWLEVTAEGEMKSHA